MTRGAMETPVEVEFAVNLDPDPVTGKPTFYLLQVKHQLMDNAEVNLQPADLDPAKVFLFSEKCVGNGIVDGLRDIVWVDPDTFNLFNTVDLAQRVELLNDKFRTEGGKYLLIGPGRWGSTDIHLGIPITWSMISCAQAIVEYATATFQVDASLGSHFFHNVTSLNIGYFTIPYPRGLGHPGRGLAAHPAGDLPQRLPGAHPGGQADPHRHGRPAQRLGGVQGDPGARPPAGAGRGSGGGGAGLGRVPIGASGSVHGSSPIEDTEGGAKRIATFA